jgi:flagellar motor switch protein FliN/FliY
VAAIRKVADKAAISLHQSLDSRATLAIGQPPVIPLPERPGNPSGSPLVELTPLAVGDVVVVVPNPAISASKRAQQPSSKLEPDSGAGPRAARGTEAKASPPCAPEAAVYAEALMKIRVPAAAVLAERRLPMGQVLRITPGTVLRFGTSCARPLELEVGGRRIAVGEAVTIGEHFGLRITELLR